MRTQVSGILLQILFLLICQTTLIVSATAMSVELELPGYQRHDGAMTVHINGDTIDPYFATKALLAAQEAGLDIRRSGMKWIEWALQHQRSDGSFDRFCIKDEDYIVCAHADADDAMMAVWIELLIKLTPPTGMPSSWETSLRLASRYLSGLHDKDTGIYFISNTLRVGLLMDNVEVYSAQKTLREFYSASGDTARARIVANEAAQLRRNIVRVFWQPRLKNLRVSTQDNTKSGFYPDQVAQLYPLIANMPIPLDKNTIYTRWMASNRQAWLWRTDIDYPWGLVALAASKMADHDSVKCWLAHARPLRHGQHWNILEETLYQAFAARTLLNNDALVDNGSRLACHGHTTQ